MCLFFWFSTRVHARYFQIFHWHAFLQMTWSEKCAIWFLLLFRMKRNYWIHQNCVYSNICCFKIFFCFYFCTTHHWNDNKWLHVKKCMKRAPKKKNHKYTQQIKTNGLALNDINQSAFQMLLVCIKVFITANKSMDLQSLLHHHRSFNFVFG